jgi:predicted transcriptional regulator
MRLRVTGDERPLQRFARKVTMTDTASQPLLLQLTAQIVAAHTSHNHLTSEALLGLIGSVYTTLATTGVAAPIVEKAQPAVPIKKSVFPDHIVCLEDGKKLKMLKRHLATTYNLTPEQYRERWGLPASYPMVAPDYAERRSTLAKSIGLGRKPAAKPALPTTVPAAAPQARRGRSPRQAAAE